MLTFEQFQTNVQQWSTARGIYEHSSALAQALKAVSEVGELADATIKNDLDALKDAIGDVAVCLVNVAYMTGVPIEKRQLRKDEVAECKVKVAAHVSHEVTGVAVDISYDCGKLQMIESIGASIAQLKSCATHHHLDFLDCCSAAWNEIKDRTGRMVAGGAFVKDE